MFRHRRTNQAISNHLAKVLRFSGLFILTIVFLNPGTARAVEWGNQTQGFYDDPTRWVGGLVPTSEQRGDFNGINNTLILWDDSTGDTTSLATGIFESSVTFTGCCGAVGIPFTHTTGDVQLTRGSLTLSQLPTEPMNLTITSNLSVGPDSELVIQHGSVVTTKSFVHGTGLGNSTVTVDGQGSALNVDDFSFIGFSNAATLNLRNQSTATFSSGFVLSATSFLTVASGSQLQIGNIVGFASNFNEPGSSAFIQVTGAGSLIDQTGDHEMVVGAIADTDALVIINSGGRVNTGAQGLIVRNTGEVIVEQGGTLSTRGATTIDGGRLAFEFGSTPILSRVMTVENSGVFDLSGLGALFSFNNDSDIMVTSGGELLNDAVIVGEDSPGVLTIDGGVSKNLSTFEVGAQGTVHLTEGLLETHSFNRLTGGNFNHTGGTLTVNGCALSGIERITGANAPTVVLDNGATASLGSLQIGISPIGTNGVNSGKLEVLNGSSLQSTGTLSVGKGGGTGTLTIDNATATFENLDLANTTFPGATVHVDVRNGGVLGVTGFVLARTGRRDNELVAITIDGNGSQLNHTGDSFFSVGKNFPSQAVNSITTVDVTNGGAIRTGTGITTIDDLSIVTVTGNGSLLAAGGQLELLNGSSTTVGLGAEITAVGEVTLEGALTLDGTVTAEAIVDIGATGSVSGTGSLSSGNGVNNSGMVSPGTSVGTVTITGDYNQQATGSLEIELGGTAPGEFDRLIVNNGGAFLDGFLNLSLVDGYVPTLGDFIPFLSAGGIIGEFSVILQPGMMPSDLAFQVNYLGAFAQLEVVAATLAGDFNADGTVDAADYTVWRAGLGTTFTEADYNVWRANYGATQATASSAAAVPEPSSLMLILLAGLGISRRRT